MLILEAEKKGQYGFAAPTDAVEVSDEEALITQVFKTAVPGLPGQNGIRQGENAELKNLTAESGTFAGAVNANGGVNIPCTIIPASGGGWPRCACRLSARNSRPGSDR